MITARVQTVIALMAAVSLTALSGTSAYAASTGSQVVSRELRSEGLAHSKIGTSPLRKMVVYLPAGYEASAQRYPVIYYCANSLDGFRYVFDQNHAQDLFDRAIATGTVGPFILVSVDMNTPLGNSWFVNSPVTGNWEDLLVKELVPYMDGNFRTLAARNSRGLLGDRMGGYGALRLGMRHPEIFGSVYALHPVGTGSGVQIMDARPNWDVLANAKSLDDLKGDIFSTIFTTIFQAHLPNPDKPPLFVDLPAHKTGDRLIIDPKLTDQLRNNFLLETMVPQYADNLKSLQGLKFDWGRSDANQDHVYANQAFTHKLNEYGIEHEAEEYNGAWGEHNWGEEGRIYNEALPFFRKHLAFEGNRP